MKKLLAALFGFLAHYAFTQTPFISTFTPTSGTVGTTVTINGNGFNSTPANNIVIFGATAATVTAATPIQLTVTVPIGATYAPITVLNTSTNLLAYSISPFTPTFAPTKGSITAADFDPKVDISTGNNLQNMAIGDIDGDGKADLATTFGSVVLVFRNTGTSGSVSYAPGVSFSTGTSSNISIAIGDLDGDGKPDLATIGSSGSQASVLRNTSSPGTVNFAFFQNISVDNNLSSIVIIDLDLDGKADVAASRNLGGGGRVTVVRNLSSSGSLSFSASQNFGTGGGFDSQSIAAADLDGDGKPELVTANFGDNSVSVFRNGSSSGSIFFSAPFDFITGSGPYSVAVGDLDGDGKADLAVANSLSNTVSVLRNTGVPSISFATKVDFTTGTAPRSVSIGDLDGDGKPDLAIANNSANTTSVLRNTGSSGTVSFAPKVDLTTFNNPESVAIGDLDGDGKSDLAVATFASTISVIRNNPVIPPPTITSLTPASGPVGTSVTITGTNFNTTPANNVVIFGATAATVTAATATQLTVTVPVGATYSPITVLNTFTGLLAYSNSLFTPTFTPVKAGITAADFDPRFDFTAGTNPRSVAVGDFDGDGKADLAVANSSSNTVSVFRNTGSSGNVSYAPKVDFNTDFTPRYISVGDLDGDGKLDLATANSSTVSVLQNTGSAGTISFATASNFSANVNPYSVSIGDLDGDGKADLAIANNGSNNVSVLRNISNTAIISFATKVDFITGGGSNSVAIGDLDGDGKADLAVANSGSTNVSVLRNTGIPGSINFAAKVDFSTGIFPNSVSLGDLDEDGKLDMAVTNSGGNNVSVFRNTGSSGTVNFAVKVDFATGDAPLSVCIADLDGDGKKDLAVANNGVNSLSVFRNTGSSGTVNFASKLDLITGFSPAFINTGDLDGDGKVDLVVCDNVFNVSIFRSNPIPNPPTVSSFSPTSGQVGTSVTISGTNFNTTPANNVVVFGATAATVTAATATQLTVTVPEGATYAPITVLNTATDLLGTSPQFFTPTFSPSKGSITAADFVPKVDFATNSSPRAVATGDLDGDGKADLVVANLSGGNVSVFRNTGSSGSVSYAPKVDFVTGVAFGPDALAIGDLDGDGKADLAVAGTGNSIAVFRNTSNIGTINFAAKVDLTTAVGPVSVSIGDLDGDGKPDLAVVNQSSNSISVFRNLSTTGNLTFTPKQDFLTSFDPRSAVIGDFDGDGKPDLAVASGGSNTVSVLRNLGNPGVLAFDASLFFSTGNTASSISVGDLDGDGKADLAVTIFDSNTAAIFRNTGSPGTINFAARVEFATSNNPNAISLGDLDGDGKADLAVVNQLDNSISVLRNTGSSGTVNFATKVDFAAGSNPISTAVADMDGDGKSDIVFTNSSSNTFSVLRNNPLPPAPTITSFSPAVGPVGTTITITGSNFNTTPGNNIVIFGATRATVTAATATQLTVTLPVGATHAPITVLNTGTDLLASSNRYFTPTFSPSKGSITTADFEPKIDFSTGSNSLSVALGDLDGDGKSDLAVANTDNTISVFRNTGGSGSVSYAAKVDFITEVSPNAISIGDLDGDGKADLAVSNQSSNSVSVFRNTGSSGTISFATRVDFSAGGGPSAVAMGDLDGDGKLDLAVTNQFSSNVSVFRNGSTSGNINFAAKVDFGISSSPRSVSISDLDGDGKPDLAVAGNFSFSVLRNTSALGVVTFATNVDFSTTGTHTGISLGDLDGDGKTDVALTTFGNNISVFRNTGSSGTVSFATRVDFLTGSNSIALAMGDLDGDGKADLAVANNSSNFASVLRNTGSSGTISFATKVDLIVGNSPISVAVGDLDGDGKADLAVASQSSSSVSVLRNNPVAAPTISSFTPASGLAGATVTISGTNFHPTAANNIVFFGATQAAVSAATSVQLTVSVPNGATYAPITVLNAITGLMAFSTASFTPIFTPTKGSITAADFAAKVDFATGTGPYSIAMGDLDGDGKPDLAVANRTSNTVSVYRNTSFSSLSYDPKVDFTTGTGPRSVAIGDLDGDGKPELTVANSTGNSVSVFLNQSSGTISFAAKVDYATGTTPVAVSIGDLDGDGRADLAVANSGTTTASVLRNTSSPGALNFATAANFTTGTAPFSISVRDLDGDGKADLAVANSGSNSVSVLRNTGSAGTVSFAGKVDFATGTNPQSVSIGDLDGDGKADLAIANNGSATSSVLRNTGNIGTINFAVKVDFTTGTAPSSVSLGDLDGDGKADLAVSNSTSTSVSVLRNTGSSGTVNFAAKVDFTTGNNPLSVVIGDSDGDGMPDLNIANDGSNTVSIIRNNPVFSPTITSFTPPGGPVGFSGVNITGTNFDLLPANNIVMFNGVAATVTASTPTSITATVPVGATTGTISVTRAGNTATSSNVFTVFTPTTFGNGQSANVVLGQSNFTSNTPGGSTTGIIGTGSAAVDPTTGKVFVVDGGNNRILRFSNANASINGSAAEAVIGQPDFTTYTPGLAANKLNGPWTITVDNLGNLWVADFNNNRVLRFANASSLANGANATSVLGQADFTSSASPVQADKVNGPAGLAVDPQGNLYVGQRGSNRVSRFSFATSLANGSAASAVFGQPNFTSSAAATTSNGLNRPNGVAVDNFYNLWVADELNGRVMRFHNANVTTSGPNALAVVGKPDFTTPGQPAAARNTITCPLSVATDNNGNLYVGDWCSNRILIYANSIFLNGAVNASVVLGQPNFTSAASVLSASGLTNPGLTASAVDAGGNLWVGDNQNRALRYGALTNPTLSGFPNLNKTLYDASFTLVAPTSDSPGAFSYVSSDPAVATISGSTVTILAVGVTTITATQAPSGSFASGTIPATLTVTAIETVTTFGERTLFKQTYPSKNGQLGGQRGVDKNGKEAVVKD